MAKLTGHSFGITNAWIGLYNKETGEFSNVTRLKVPATLIIKPYLEDWRYLPIIWQRRK